MVLRTEILVPLAPKRGASVAHIRLLDRQGATILILSEADAAARAEEVVQLLESRSYDFELVAPVGFRLEETPLVQPNRANGRLGRIEPGLQTGLLTLTLLDTNGEPAAAAGLE